MHQLISNSKKHKVTFVALFNNNVRIKILHIFLNIRQKVIKNLGKNVIWSEIKVVNFFHEPCFLRIIS